MKSIYKKILSIGLVSALFEVALTRQAYALDWIESIGSGVITKGLQVILGFMAAVAQKIFMLGGMLIELAMSLNNTILDPNSNVFLFKGWTVFVNVADLALVISLIIIAFATMLNMETYGMKKNLWRLIVMALLVNFSLVLPGVLMDLSGMVTEFFVQQSGLKGSNITSALASAFDISGFLSTKNAEGQIIGAMTKFGSSIMNILLSATFVVVFTVVATVIMLTIAVMLFVRYFVLTFLLVLTPIVFVAWIFPTTKHHWDDWWNRFVRWTMFPPVMVFFMWLSLTSLNAFKNPAPAQNAPGGSYGSATYAFGDGLFFNLSSVIQMAMAVMMMMMSLIAANSISIKGAKGSKDMIATMSGWSRGKIEGWGKGTKAYAQREAERAGRRTIARPVAALGVGAAAMRKYEGQGKFGGKVVGALGRAGEKVTGAQQAALKKTYEDKFKGMSDDNLAMRYATMAADEKTFAVAQLIKSGKLSKVDEKILERDIADASTKAAFEKYGGEKAYKDMTKAAGRSAEMIKAKQEVDAIDKDTTLTGFQKMSKKADAEKAYKEVAKKFYSDFAKKDYEALGTDFYKKGKYGKEAMTAMLLNEPGAFNKIAGGVGKGAEMKDFMKEVEKIRNELRDGVVEGIKQSLKPEESAKIATETKNELVSIMKELKAKPQNKEQFDKDNAEIQALEQSGEMNRILQWIEARDSKLFKNIGGTTGLASIEDQMHLLYVRNNSAFTQMDQHTDYQHMMRIQESMRKSTASRLYAASKEEEKKP